MAEIRIEPRNAQHRRWLWLLPLALAAAVAVFFLRRNGGDETAAVSDTTTAVAAGSVDTTAAPATAAPDPTVAVTAFTSFVGRGEPEMADTAQLRYAANGLTQLSDALSALAGPRATPALTAALTVMRTQAAQLPGAPGVDPTHAEIAKPAFTAAATALGEVQRIRGSGDVAPAVRTAGTIGSRGPLRPQREKIQTFFDQAATALQTMLGTSGSTPGADTSQAGGPRRRTDTAGAMRRPTDTAGAAGRAPRRP